MNSLEIEKKSKTMEGTVQERLEEFCKIFVKSFEQKIFEYKKEAAVGGNPKIGKTARLLMSPVKSAGTVAGFGAMAAAGIPGTASRAAGEGSSAVANYLYGKKHRRKAKQVMKIIALMNKDELRKILLKVAGGIFAAFEEQFSKVTDVDGSWIRAMEKLAVESMDRSINYIQDFEINNPCVTAVVNSDFIIKSVVLGESKRGAAADICNSVKLNKLEDMRRVPDKIKNGVPKSGHTLKYKEELWKISDLFKGVGLVRVDVNGVCEKYFRKRYGDKADKYRYRKLFSWEDEKSYRGYIKPKKIYKYILNQDDLENLLLKFLEDINKEDPEKAHEIIYETNAIVCQIKEIVEDVSDICKESGEEIHVLHKKVDQVQEAGLETLHFVQHNQEKLVGILDVENEVKDKLIEISEHGYQTDEKISEIGTDTKELVGNLQSTEVVLNDLAHCTNETLVVTVNKILDVVQSEEFTSPTLDNRINNLIDRGTKNLKTIVERDIYKKNLKPLFKKKKKK